MPLKFCKKCEVPLVPTVINNELFLECNRCGKMEKSKDWNKISSNEKIPPKTIRKGGVVSDKINFAGYSNKCPKCGYNKAEIIDMGVFYSDEDNLILLKCGKCGFSERVGRKVS